MHGHVRAIVKRGIERLVVGLAGPDIVRLLKGRKPVILAYHNVIPEGKAAGGDRSLHLPLKQFERQVNLVSETHEVVPLSRILEQPPADEVKPRAAITFDDGYRGALTAGLKVLARHGLPATFFVCPGLVGARGLWWDELAPEGAEGIPAGFRERALVDARGVADEVYRLAESWGLSRRSQPEHAGLATEDELRRAAAFPGATFGSHTWSHPSLDQLDDSELHGELARSLRWLEERFGEVTVPWLSLPYGRSAPVIHRVARDLGYVRGLRITGGLARPKEGEWTLARVNVPSGASLDRFALATAGI